MSKVFVKSLKHTRKGKKVILPCGLVEFNQNCVAEIEEDDFKKLSSDDLDLHFLEVVEDAQGSVDADDSSDSDSTETKVSRNSLNQLNLEEAQNMAIQAEFPEEEWQEFGVTKLRDYLYKKLNADE